MKEGNPTVIQNVVRKQAEVALYFVIYIFELAIAKDICKNITVKLFCNMEIILTAIKVDDVRQHWKVNRTIPQCDMEGVLFSLPKEPECLLPDLRC